MKWWIHGLALLAVVGAGWAWALSQDDVPKQTKAVASFFAIFGIVRILSTMWLNRSLMREALKKAGMR